MSRQETSGTETRQDELVARVEAEVRKMGAQSVLTSHAIAAHFGLHSTDLECLDVLEMKGGRATAGELAKATGLTTGATTSLIDRLERAGLVRRAPDREDRRRVHVEIDREATAPIAAVYAPMQEKMTAHWSNFTSGELDTVLRFLAGSNALAINCLENLGKLAPRAARKRGRISPNN